MGSESAYLTRGVLAAGNLKTLMVNYVGKKDDTDSSTVAFITPKYGPVLFGSNPVLAPDVLVRD